MPHFLLPLPCDYLLQEDVSTSRLPAPPEEQPQDGRARRHHEPPALPPWAGISFQDRELLVSLDWTTVTNQNQFFSLHVSGSHVTSWWWALTPKAKRPGLWVLAGAQCPKGCVTTNRFLSLSGPQGPTRLGWMIPRALLVLKMQ